MPRPRNKIKKKMPAEIRPGKPVKNMSLEDRMSLAGASLKDFASYVKRACPIGRKDSRE